MFPALPPPPQDPVRDNLGQSPEQVYAYAAELLRGGTQPAAVRQKLIDLGFDEKAASTVVHDLLAAPVGPSLSILRPEAVAPASVARDAARRQMTYGAIWFFAGLLITLGSLAAAAQGGSYVVAWGAMLYGAIVFFRGASQT
jgi:hypothetical protein